jgi:hypothetical protein
VNISRNYEPTLTAPSMSPVDMQPKILDAFLFRKVYAVYMEWRAGFSSCGECDMDRLGFISFHPPFCEAMPGSLSVASTANFGGFHFVEFGRSAMHSRYNSGPRTFP